MGESYWDLVLRQFRRNRIAVGSLVFVLFLFLIAIGAPFLANNNPIVLRGAYLDVYRDRFQEWKVAGHRELAEFLVVLCGGHKALIQSVPDRPGHDLRYALDCFKIQDQLNWRPTRSEWPAALLETVEWYRENADWWEPLIRGDRKITSGF